MAVVEPFPPANRCYCLGLLLKTLFSVLYLLPLGFINALLNYTTGTTEVSLKFVASLGPVVNQVRSEMRGPL